jgi:hypothetical protein
MRQHHSEPSVKSEQTPLGRGVVHLAEEGGSEPHGDPPSPFPFPTSCAFPSAGHGRRPRLRPSGRCDRCRRPLPEVISAFTQAIGSLRHRRDGHRPSPGRDRALRATRHQELVTERFCLSGPLCERGGRLPRVALLSPDLCRCQLNPRSRDRCARSLRDTRRALAAGWGRTGLPSVARERGSRRCDS